MGDKFRSLSFFSIILRILVADAKEVISKNTLYVIPACRESFWKKDCGQAAMTEIARRMPFYFWSYQ
jgi:hypothetical protein